MGDLFFYSSKLLWSIFSPDGLFVLLLATSVGLIYLNCPVLARHLLTGLLIIVVLMSLFPVGSWLLYPLESRFHHNPELPAQIDGIIVLGGSIEPVRSQAWNQLEMNYSAERITSFITLARRYPGAKLVFTGGNASLDRNKPTEAHILSLHLDQFKLDPRRIQFEGESKNTAENAFLTKRLVRPPVSSNWVLITTAYHMPRSVGVFCQNDWPLIPYPVDHQVNPGNLFEIDFNLLGHATQLNMAVHEWLGLLAYYLTGKIPDLVPDMC